LDLGTAVPAVAVEDPVRAVPRYPRPPKRDNASRAATHRYRFAFQKLGPAALLGHLDLIRALARVFRRAGLPVAYSQGFHPKPDMTFSPALSLGVIGLGEYLDVKLGCEADAAALCPALTAAAPQGLVFTNGVRLGPEDAGITKVIARARYLIVVPRTALGPSGGEEWLVSRAAWVLEQPSIRVRREIESLAKYVDVRSYLIDLAVAPEDASALLERAGLVGDLAVVDARVHMPGSGGVKGSEIAEVLFDGRDLPYRLVRVALEAEGSDHTTIDPIEPSRLRRPRTTQPEPITAQP
jgi:radical SAM-linked protein